MSDLGTVHSDKPKYADETIILAGTKAYELVIEYQAQIEPRLQTGTSADLTADLLAVGAAIPAAQQARTETRVSVATQRKLLAKGATLCRGIRDAVRENTTDRDLRKAYGVGARLNAKVAKDVLAVLNLIQDRAAKYPAEPATLGITQKDLDAVKQAIADIGVAFNARQKQRAAAPLTTARRNRILNRIVRAVGRISAAGKLEFTAEPEIAQRFADLDLPPIPKKKSAKKIAKPKPSKSAAKPAEVPKEAPAEEAPAQGTAAPVKEDPAAEASPPAAPAPSPATPAEPPAEG
jgi:hypothetical protein